jgi:AraC-like DNA-binding protein
MDNFSAAAIARIIPLGLKRLGLSASLQSAPQAAHIAIDEKRRLLNTVASSHGEQVLAELGAGVLDATDEPLLSAFSPARGPHDLIARWQRLERYVHSSHRVRVDTPGEHRVVLHHVAIQRRPKPHRHEDLLVFGLLIGLLELTGAQGLRARTRGEHGWRYGRRLWRTAPWPPDVSQWELQWEADVGGLDQATRAANGRPKQGLDPNDCVGFARHLMSQDPAHAWTVKALAADMNTTARSLQRHLALQQNSFTALLAQIKVASAAQLLTTTMEPPAQIGYGCGYSDQAHFSREFKRHTAFTPLQYRAAFAVGRPADPAEGP